MRRHFGSNGKCEKKNCHPAENFDNLNFWAKVKAKKVYGTIVPLGFHRIPEPTVQRQA